MSVTPLPSFTSPDKSIGRLGLAIVRRFFAGYRRHGNEALANTFSLDPLGSVQWRFAWRRIIRWRTLKSR